MIDSKIFQKMTGRYLEASDTQEEYLWHCVKKHEVLEEPQDYEIERRETPRYNPDPEAGLSEAQVEQHRDDGWRNVSVAPPAQTTKEIIRENVCTYFNLIFLVLANFVMSCRF
mgnify:CR=1 FL=1